MPTVNLTIGKLRGLGQCATRRSAFSVLALDHRNNLRQLLRPDAPDSVPLGELVTFKQQVIGALAPAASAVLLDPEFGVAQCIASGALPGNVGLLVAAEATGYIGDPGARQSQILPGWSIAKTRRMGASAANYWCITTPTRQLPQRSSRSSEKLPPSAPHKTCLCSWSHCLIRSTRRARNSTQQNAAAW